MCLLLTEKVLLTNNGSYRRSIPRPTTAATGAATTELAARTLPPVAAANTVPADCREETTPMPTPVVAAVLIIEESAVAAPIPAGVQPRRTPTAPVRRPHLIRIREL